MGGQHQRVDRPGLLIDTKGSRRQEEMETAGFKVIGGDPTTLCIMGLMMIMMKQRRNIYAAVSTQLYSTIYF